MQVLRCMVVFDVRSALVTGHVGRSHVWAKGGSPSAPCSSAPEGGSPSAPCSGTHATGHRLAGLQEAQMSVNASCMFKVHWSQLVFVHCDPFFLHSGHLW